MFIIKKCSQVFHVYTWYDLSGVTGREPPSPYVYCPTITYPTTTHPSQPAGVGGQGALLCYSHLVVA